MFPVTGRHVAYRLAVARTLRRVVFYAEEFRWCRGWALSVGRRGRWQLRANTLVVAAGDEQAKSWRWSGDWLWPGRCGGVCRVNGRAAEALLARAAFSVSCPTFSISVALNFVLRPILEAVGVISWSRQSFRVWIRILVEGRSRRNWSSGERWRSDASTSREADGAVAVVAGASLPAPSHAARRFPPPFVRAGVRPFAAEGRRVLCPGRAWRSQARALAVAACLR